MSNWGLRTLLLFWLSVVTGGCKPIAASPAARQQIDSDDDQPLEALKLGLKQALQSSQQSPSVEAQAEQQQPAVKKKAAKKLVSKKTTAAAAHASIADDEAYQAAAWAFASSSLGKENWEAMSSGLSDPFLDSDNWNLEPLQRRGKRQAAKKGATECILDAADPPLQQEEQHNVEQRQAQQQRQQRRNSLSGQPQLQQERQQHMPWQEATQEQQPAADPAVAATAEPVLQKQKRQRRTSDPNTRDDFDHPDSQPTSDVHDPEFDFGQPSAAAAAAAGASGKARAGSRASSRAAASGGSARVRMTAEERAAKKAEEKAHKEAEKIAAKVGYAAADASDLMTLRSTTLHRHLLHIQQRRICAIITAHAPLPAPKRIAAC